MVPSLNGIETDGLIHPVSFNGSSRLMLIWEISNPGTGSALTQVHTQ